MRAALSRGALCALRSRRNYRNEQGSRYSFYIYILIKIEKEHEIIFYLEISSLHSEGGCLHWKMAGIGLYQTLARILLLPWRRRRDIRILEPGKSLQLYIDEKFTDESI